MQDAAYQTTFKKPQQEKIEKYIDLAIEFNKTHNIFVRKNRQEIIDKDIIDCSPLVKIIAPNKSIADLGSGGGFPGLLLSITTPESKITPIAGPAINPKRQNIKGKHPNGIKIFNR